jgi:2-keto-4-pentenoate hydratase/2-oxohepta-3-ene-1,7-dioic acid hydratase in catechol pathway
MRLARVSAADGTVHLARLEDDGSATSAVLLARESGHPAADVLREALAAGADMSADGERVRMSDVRVLAPVARPSKIIAVGLNYRAHAAESAMAEPEAPLLFVKTPNSVVGPGDEIVVDEADTRRADYEVELAAVIGRRARRVPVGSALDHVLGYTVGNDVSARDAQFSDTQWVRGKSFDTFCPLGPWIVTADEIGDPQSLRVTCDVNGGRLQDDSTTNMIFPVAQLVAYASRFMTLEPGDVILTGTPDGVGFARRPPVYLVPGDTVTVAVDRIGELTNPVTGA